MAKKILFILGHPSEESFCKALLDAYKNGAESSNAIANPSSYQTLNSISTYRKDIKTGKEWRLKKTSYILNNLSNGLTTL
jgi:putative NADPH-quinone reductase